MRNKGKDIEKWEWKEEKNYKYNFAESYLTKVEPCERVVSGGNSSGMNM